MQNAHFLIVDDDTDFCLVFASGLKHKGFKAHVASTHAEALEIAQHFPLNFATIDLKLANESGLSIIPGLKKLQPEVRILLLTGYASIATAVEAIKLGAENYVMKPATVDEILNVFTNDSAHTQQETKVKIATPDHKAWEHIHQVLKDTGFNISESARKLGMHRRTLQRKLQKYQYTE